MPRRSTRPPARKKDGGIDRRGTKHQQKSADELPVGDSQTVAAEQRRTRVSELMGQALTQYEIAELVGASQKTVCFDMTAIRLEWRELRMARYEEAKDEVHGWALQNYRRAHKLLTKAEGAGDHALARLCLQEARKCAEQVGKLLGLYPATQKDIDPKEALQRLAARLSVDPSQMVM